MKQYLENATGVDTFLIISLFIFLLFFLAVGFWLLKVDKNYIAELKQIPLNDTKVSVDAIKKGGNNVL